MKETLSNLVNFRSDRLFNGAVNIEWFTSDVEKSQLASEAFVFHGPKYHSVNQDDIGDQHGHKLIDTANFTKSILQRSYNPDLQPFTLAIAGYGTGKSHLGLTIANLVNSPESQISGNILSSLNSADADIHAEISSLIHDVSQPCLVLTLNGMRGFDLSAEITKQLTTILKQDGHDTKYLDELRPRFGQAISLVKMSNDSVKADLVKFTNEKTVQSIISLLEQHEEQLYLKVYDFFEQKGMPIRVLSGESVRDVIDIAVREYCGNDKPYRSILILFDEFGKYTEFATIRSQIAGNGVLQDLFEAVQSNSNSVCFVGFIQFELNAYVKRIAPEYKNEILRYVTRYQSADKLYLSVNLETLIANLIEKKDSNILDRLFESPASLTESYNMMEKMSRWFPHFNNYATWNNENTFHTVIRKGCWPLSPLTTWLLFYLASAGKHLQERSALALLSESFNKFQDKEIDVTTDWTIRPVDICSEALISELISSEESGQQGSITHSYVTVIAKHGNRLSNSQISLLQAILIGSKIGLVNENLQDALDALSDLTGINREQIHQDVTQLQEEYNVIEWDESFKAFDILGDAVPRTQFLSFLRQQVAVTHDENSKSAIFASKGAEWCDLLSDLECDFAEENKITTREWRYTSVTTNLDYIPQQIKIATDRWMSATEVDQSKGTIMYCYSEPSRSEVETKRIISKVLKEATKNIKVKALPIIVAVVHDIEGILGQYLAEYSILSEISEAEKAKFGNLIDAHKEKLKNSIRESIDNLLKNRIIIIPYEIDANIRRLSHYGKFVFSRLYSKPISFPFDGFSTARGNAADSCYELTSELLHGKLDFNLVTAKTVKVKNRAISVLKENWGIFNKNGSISRRPSHNIIKNLMEKWDNVIQTDQKIPVLQILEELFLPPYGANIASAGLILGVFISARHDNLIIMKNGAQLGVDQWIQEGVFRGKFINIRLLQNSDLIHIGEASSEWETLLDDWEQCQQNQSLVSFLEKAEILKQRIPIPPTSIYREERLKERSVSASLDIERINNIQDDAWDRIDVGYQSSDCGKLSWGAKDLKCLLDEMREKMDVWSESEVNAINEDYAKARQYTIEAFDEWLDRQTPKSNTPSDVGDFKHLMIRKTGGNLRIIDLEDQFTRLETYTKDAIRKTEKIVEARDLISHIKAWLLEHTDAMKTKHIAEARVLKGKGGDFLQRLTKIRGQIKIPDGERLSIELTDFISQLGEIEQQLFNKASALWDSEISCAEDLDLLSVEVDTLISSFEGLETDLEDLLAMRKAIRLFQDCFDRIHNKQITWAHFHNLHDNLIQICCDQLGDEEIPWDYEKVISELFSSESIQREVKSQEWIGEILKSESKITTMNASEANQLMNQLSSPPLFITKQHTISLNNLNEGINSRISELEIHWMIEKFKELSSENKSEFIAMAKKLLP
jgi:hypothetical protein